MNNEPDVSAANSPAADQIETGSPCPDANVGDDKDIDAEEEGEGEEAKSETDHGEMCEDNKDEDDTKLDAEKTSQVTFFDNHKSTVVFLTRLEEVQTGFCLLELCDFPFVLN